MNIKLKAEEALEVVNSESNDFELVKEEITGQRRWLTEWTAVYRHAPTGKLYLFKYDRASTESQEDSQPFNANYSPDVEYEFPEVMAVERTVVKYEPVP